MNSEATGVTSSQEESLVILMEELGETIQAISKILRFGYGTRYPINSAETNQDNLNKEIAHVLCQVQILIEMGVVNPEQVPKFQIEKFHKLGQFVHNRFIKELSLHLEQEYLTGHIFSLTAGKVT